MLKQIETKTKTFFLYFMYIFLIKNSVSLQTGFFKDSFTKLIILEKVEINNSIRASVILNFKIPNSKIPAKINACLLLFILVFSVATTLLIFRGYLQESITEFIYIKKTYIIAIFIVSVFVAFSYYFYSRKDKVENNNKKA